MSGTLAQGIEAHERSYSRGLEASQAGTGVSWGTKELRLKTKGDREQDKLIEVVAYSDADYAADKEDSRPGAMDGMPVSWMCWKHGRVSLSTMETECTAASVMAAELLGARVFLGELSVKYEALLALSLDGESVSSKVKHIGVHKKFVRDNTQRGILKPEYCAGKPCRRI
ncbi:polyprotein [Phytophthora megakarya]|uniref:Polyprotein n=1 Tax=Phytophthora megakarya TaxID=4795 RepID=A0A225VSG3_9STRA|nr:polyprotein [Phytophthora megakarya]